MPSRFTIVLVGSLALNAALVGIVVGRWLTPRTDEPSVLMQLERYGPTSDVVAAAWAQLPEEDRTELRRQLRESWVAMSDDRKRLSEAGKAVYDAALADPFDEGKLRDTVAIFQSREKKLQGIAEDILISHLGRMPPKARATAATGLLTPFNARLQRADGRDGARAGVQGGDAPPVLSPDK
ncbi:MAG: periplasmic heavy metal sensor [Hyphomonadaceae bacterium]